MLTNDEKKSLKIYQIKLENLRYQARIQALRLTAIERIGIIETRANPYHDERGRFASAPGQRVGKHKYAPSPQRSKGGIKLSPKRYVIPEGGVKHGKAEQINRCTES